MDTHISLTSLLITLSLFSTVTPLTHCIEDDPFHAYKHLFECGNLTNISFPFWGRNRSQFCGHRRYQLECRNDEYAVMKIQELEFRVLNINQSIRSMTIARMDLWDIQSSCPQKFVNTSLNYSSFEYDQQKVQNLTLAFNCSSQVNISKEKRFLCGSKGGDRYNNIYYLDEFNHTEEVAKCHSRIQVPILRRGGALLSNHRFQERGNQTALFQSVLNEGFQVQYHFAMPIICKDCENSGEKCGSNSSQAFVCYCRDKVNSFMCGRVGTYARTLNFFCSSSLD